MFLECCYEVAQMFEPDIHGNIHNLVIGILKLNTGLRNAIIIDIVDWTFLHHLFEKAAKVSFAHIGFICQFF